MFFPAALHRWDVELGEHMICISYILSFPLVWLTRLFPMIEWYTFYIHVCHLAIVTSVSFCLVQTQERLGIRNYIGLIVLVFYVQRYMFEIEFTFVSFFTMSSGLLLILRARTSKYRKLLCLLGTIEFMMGCVIRSGASTGMLPFLGSLFFIVCFCEIYGKGRLYETLAIGWCALFVFVCGLLHSPLSTIRSDDGRKFCISYANSVRAKFTDYRDDSGLDKDDLYRRIGCTSNDLQLLEHWLYFSDECRSSEYWQKMDEIRDLGRKRFAPSRIRNLLLGGSPEYRWSILCCALLLMVRRRLRPQPADWIVLAGLMCLLILGLQGRFNDRAMIAVLLPCYLLWAALSPSFKLSRAVHVILVSISSILIIWHTCSFANLKCHFSLLGQPKWSNPGWNATFVSEHGNHTEWTSALIAECDAHPDLTYFAEGHRWRRIILPGSSICSSDLKKSLNFFPLDGWMGLFPSYQSALRRRGITQLSRLLLYDRIRLVLSAANEQELLDMKSKNELLFRQHTLEHLFTFVKEKYGIRLSLEIEKKLAENLYIVRVVRVEE